MQTVTRQGTVLSVQLAAVTRHSGGHPEPIVEFRYPGRALCSSYYLSTFNGISAGEGLCLEGGTDTRQDLSPESVAACQAWLREVVA
jgi:hypothetical protein